MSLNPPGPAPDGPKDPPAARPGATQSQLKPATQAKATRQTAGHGLKPKLSDVGVHVLPDRDAAHRDRLADQAGQQELEVVVARAVGDRPAEHEQEQHQEDDRLQRDVDELLGRAGELDQVALAEHERGPQPETHFHTSASSSWARDLVPVRVKKTSSRLGRCSENSSTAIPAARSRATTSGSTSSPSTGTVTVPRPSASGACPLTPRSTSRRSSCRAGSAGRTVSRCPPTTRLSPFGVSCAITRP